MIEPRGLVGLALGVQAGLAVLALGAARVLDLALPVGRPGDVLAGLAAAAALALANWWVIRHAPAVWPVTSVRHVYRVLIVPLFARIGARAAVIVGLAAGVGEELLFRGVLQPLVGLPLASLLFGAAHVAGREMVGFGVWAACMGAVLGALMAGTGGLLAPVVAHGVYDALALTYIRRAEAPRAAPPDPQGDERP